MPNLDIPVVQLSREIFYVDDFLSIAECRSIMDELEIAFWQSSKIITYLPGSESHHQVLAPSRISETAHQEWFSADLNAMLGSIEKRLELYFDIDNSKLEYWQATQYPMRGKFDYHLDAGFWEKDNAGERVHTILLYLDTPLKGGSTHFRALDLEIKPKTGRMVIWKNLFENGDCNYKMIHASLPLLKGTKTTLVTWERQKKHRT